jgi:hypothetical protein
MWVVLRVIFYLVYYPKRCYWPALCCTLSKTASDEINQELYERKNNFLEKNKNIDFLFSIIYLLFII